MKMMKCLLFAGVLLLSCNDSSVNPVLNPLSFRIGQEWIYTWKGELKDSAGTILSLFTDSLKVRVVAVNDSVGGMVNLVRLDAMSLTPERGASTPGTKSVWYKVTASNIQEVAYRNAGAVVMVMPKVSGSISTVKYWNFFDPLHETRGGTLSDSTIVRDDPRVIVVLPLKQGTSWTSFTSPWPQTREVVGIETMNVGPMILSAAKIQTHTSIAPDDFYWYDWIANEGLIHRTIEVKLLFTTVDSPGAGVMGSSFEELTLVSMK